MSKRKEITSYFQPKKKQTTTCEDEERFAASIEVTGDGVGVEPLLFGGINRNSEQNPQNPEIVNEGIDSENTDEIIDFNSLIRDQQLQELNNRFSEQMTELFILSASLNPRDGYRSLNIENICKLAEKFYPEDFLGDEKIHLQCELQNYGLDVPVHPDLKNLSTLGDFCHGLVTTGKADMYPLVDRLLRLVLTIRASTATSERSFSAIKIVKKSLRNRMKDEFLRDYLIVYIEKEIAETISAQEIIDFFYLITCTSQINQMRLVSIPDGLELDGGYE
ncbi:hypothetical protein AgCh_029663 [Apium graveolens]